MFVSIFDYKKQGYVCPLHILLRLNPLISLMKPEDTDGGYNLWKHKISYFINQDYSQFYLHHLQLSSPTFLFCVLQPYFPQFKKIEMDSKMPNLRVSKV